MGMIAILASAALTVAAPTGASPELQQAARERDPAGLINLASIEARKGNTGEARNLLLSALASPERYEVELADGRLMDVRDAARLAYVALASRAATTAYASR